MTNITNTTKNPKREWLYGGNPGAIELQEKVGQMELSKSNQLPRKTNNSEKSIYEKLGIKILERGNNDPLFVEAILPEGWKILPTEHSLWSNLVDHLNRKRAMIFYKAAFYDRDAHISFNTRYKYGIITYLENDDEKYPDFYDKKNHITIFGRVLDGDKVIHETQRDIFVGKYDEKNKERWWKNYDNLEKSKREECKKWLDEKYPEWNNIFNYWEK